MKDGRIFMKTSSLIKTIPMNLISVWSISLDNFMIQTLKWKHTISSHLYKLRECEWRCQVCSTSGQNCIKNTVVVPLEFFSKVWFSRALKRCVEYSTWGRRVSLTLLRPLLFAFRSSCSELSPAAQTICSYIYTKSVHNEYCGLMAVPLISSHLRIRQKDFL
jgi:hypothetical protein